MYLYSAEGTIATIITAAVAIAKVAIIILAIILLVKGVNYIKTKEQKEAYKDNKQTIDELEKELNEKQHQERRSR